MDPLFTINSALDHFDCDQPDEALTRVRDLIDWLNKGGYSCLAKDKAAHSDPECTCTLHMRSKALLHELQDQGYHMTAAELKDMLDESRGLPT